VFCFFKGCARESDDASIEQNKPSDNETSTLAAVATNFFSFPRSCDSYIILCLHHASRDTIPLFLSLCMEAHTDTATTQEKDRLMTGIQASQQRRTGAITSRVAPVTQSSSRNNSKTNIENQFAHGHNSTTIPVHNAVAAITTTTDLVPTSSATGRQLESWDKARKNHQEQLLTEHFGFQPLSFIDDVINSVNNMIYQASMALQEFVEVQMDEIAARAEASGQLDPNFDVKTESEKVNENPKHPQTRDRSLVPHG